MRVIAVFFGPCAPAVRISYVSVFSHDFKRLGRLTKLATSSEKEDEEQGIDHQDIFDRVVLLALYDGTMDSSFWYTPHKQLFKCQTAIGKAFKHRW